MRTPFSTRAGLKHCFFGFFLSAALFSYVHADPIAELADPDNAPEAIQRQLSKAFQDLGSFQARYRGVSPKGTMTLSLYHNRDRKQAVLIFDFEEPEPFRAVSILVFGDPDGEKGDEVSLYMGAGDQLNRMSLSLSKVLHDVSNPLGALVFFVETYAIQVERQNWDLKLGHPFPMIMLELSENTFNAGIGTQTMVEALEVSWLALPHFQDAEEIRHTPETVTLVFRNGRQLEIHRESGLLFRDQWPEDPEETPRKITLMEHGPLPDGNPGYREWIPDFETLKIESIPPVRILASMMASMHSTLLDNFDDAEAFQAGLEKNEKAFATAVREDGRILVREMAKRFVAENQFLDRLADALQKTHRNYVDAQPEGAETMSLDEYLDLHFQLFRNEPDNTLMTPLEQMARQIQQNLEPGLQLLPEGPARQLYQTALPELMNAWRLELLSATFEHAKSKAADE
ncbi:MAG: hypothetical protein JJU29_14790 [Verrucomicrobia bacterium]|nr:hypothetical protein [Verrucomicrobiota bacterium]MCH8510234.1 hypothetical protein [Kiritimatiellia bacterium]